MEEKEEADARLIDAELIDANHIDAELIDANHIDADDIKIYFLSSSLYFSSNAFINLSLSSFVIQFILSKYSSNGSASNPSFF